MDEWFRTYYGRDYAESVESRLTLARTRAEVDFLVSLMGPGDGPRRVVDLGAGKGRHAIELKRRGHAATAVELNPEFVEAGLRAEPPGVPPIRWVTGDMRRVVPGPYDVVLILFQSFGFFSDGENAALLANWSRQVGSGGLFIVDVWNLAAVLGHWAPTFQLEAPSLKVDHRQRWDPEQHRLSIHYTYHRAGNPPREYDTSFRLYTSGELTELLASVGFGEVQCFGSLTGEVYTEESARLVIAARRPSGRPPIKSG